MTARPSHDELHRPGRTSAPPAASVRDVMRTGHPSCDAATSLVQAASVMRDHGASSVVVLSGDRVRGIVSDRDIVVRCVAAGVNLGRALIVDALPLEMLTISPEASADEARALMRDHRLRSLAVVDDGRLLGVIGDELA